MRRRPLRSSSICTLQAASVVHGTKAVLSDVSLTIKPHTRIGVLGPADAGKSALLELIAGLQSPMSGTVRLSANAAISVLSAEPYLIPLVRTGTRRGRRRGYRGD